MHTITVKFGGTSLASAAQIRKAAEIVHSDPARRFVVASAPGKRTKDDIKVTDLLYRCYNEAMDGDDFTATLETIRGRFRDIITELEVSFDLDAEIEKLREHLKTAPNADYMASRGEYLNSKIIAAFLGFPFVDAAEVIRFRADGKLDEAYTFRTLSARLVAMDSAVIPGFYGALPDGTVKTFSRGGSDVTGAIVARASVSEIYENWTDVSGMLSADPRIVDTPRVIDYITYTELRELSYMGASVLHEDAVFPVRKAGIPINIRNTNRPDDPGTMIVASLPASVGRRVITGIAGKKGFSSIHIEKSMMNSEVGFVAKLLKIFASCGLSFEHCPSGIDTISIVINTDSFNPHREEILHRIRQDLEPDVVSVEDNLALIAVVGQGMVYSKGTAARVFSALYEADVNIRMIDQGSSELNIIVSVEERDFEHALRSIYTAMEGLMK